VKISYRQIIQMIKGTGWVTLIGSSGSSVPPATLRRKQDRHRAVHCLSSYYLTVRAYLVDLSKGRYLSHERDNNQNSR
jgi:hypothetical protein